MVSTMAVKCTPKTINILNNLLKKCVIFQELKALGVEPNPSWFFKFSSLVFLKNLEYNNTCLFSKIDNIADFSYDCHYVNFYEENLKNLSDIL